MATATLAPPRSRIRFIIFRWLAGGVALIALLVGAAVAWVYSMARHELPQTEGTISLNGLTAPVTIVRDKLGVPHIRAASIEDLLFAQGFVTAQDRLWQMDTSRRYAAGELAEVLGP